MFEKVAVREFRHNTVMSPCDTESARVQHVLFQNCLDPILCYSKQADEADALQRVSQLHDDNKERGSSSLVKVDPHQSLSLCEAFVSVVLKHRRQNHLNKHAHKTVKSAAQLAPYWHARLWIESMSQAVGFDLYLQDALV